MIINLHPHVVSVYNTRYCYVYGDCLHLRGELDAEGEFPQPICTYPASDTPARVTFVQKPVGAVDGILIYRWFTTEVDYLPEPKPNTYYIVFKKIAKAFPERKDLVFPGTPKTVVCIADGIVVNCVNFSRIKD